MITAERDGSGQQQRIAIIDGNIGRMCADINEDHAASAVFGQNRSVSGGDAFKYGLFDSQVRLVDGRDNGTDVQPGRT